MDDFTSTGIPTKTYWNGLPCSARIVRIIGGPGMTPANRQLVGALLMLAVLGAMIVVWAECSATAL